MKITLPDWGKGLNADALPSELADGFCSSATNIRFRFGFAEEVDGISNPGTSTSVTPYWVTLFPSANAAAGFYLVYSNRQKVYSNSINSATHTEITRYTEGVVISSMTNVTTTATVNTASAHGRTTGDTVSVWGCVPTAYNGTFTITVVDADTFTYTMASDPGGSATTIGLYSYNGATSNFTASTGVTVGSVFKPYQFTGGSFNGVLVMNSPTDGFYYWAGDTSIRMRKIPTSYKARVGRPFKNFLFQLVPTISSVEYPHRVCWSDVAEPGSIPTSFTAAATNLAGDQELAETSGELVDALPLGDSFIIYKEDARYSCQYIGGNDVFRFTRLPGSDGLLYRNCVVNTPLGHVFLSKNFEVLLHSGGEVTNLSKGRVSSLLGGAFTLSAYNRSFLTVNPSSNEVWVCLVSGSGYADRILIWNWTEDTWGRKTPANGEITHGVFGFSGISSNELLWLGGTVDKIGDVGPARGSDFGTSFTCTAERVGLALDDRDAIKNLQRSRWNFDASAGKEITISHGSAMTADATPTYATGVSYTVGTTDYANARATGGRFLAVKASWTSAASSGSTKTRVRSCDLDVTIGGKR